MGLLDPKELAKALTSSTPEQLSSYPHSLLYAARSYVPLSQQNAISPYEHQSYAREAVADNPLMAVPLAVAIPGYQAYKGLTGEGRSGASLDQLTHGYQGIGEGLQQYLAGLLSR